MGYITIMRPVNCIITFISVLVGAWIGRGITFFPNLILAGMIGFFTCGFGNIVNDLYDIEIDKVNNPKRPLPSGRVDKKLVILLALSLFIISILFSISLGFLVFLLVFGASLFLFVYAAYLKKTIAANFVVSLLTGLSFILGGTVMKNYSCIYPFIFSFFINMPREIIKDIIDIKGDEANGVVSLPMIFGKERVSAFGAFLLGVLCVLLPLPYILRILSLRYMIAVLLLAYPLIFYCMLRLLKKPSEDGLLKSSKLIKISMAVGLIAMIL